MPSVGVTGTNGKTTTTSLLGSALQALGPVFVETTLGYAIDDVVIDEPKTYAGFRRAVEHARRVGAKATVLEVTSHALAQGFAGNWQFGGGVFTNLAVDHLATHGSLEAYLAAKAQLFLKLPADGFAVLNGSDPASKLLDEIIPSTVLRLWFGHATQPAIAPLDLAIERVDASTTGTSIGLARSTIADAVDGALRTRYVGAPFAFNAVAALLAATACGVDAASAAERISNAAPVAGRFEVVNSQPLVVIDYAHSAAAITATVDTARSLCQGRLTIVTGAGGGIDREQKHRIARASAAYADRVVFTSDNPRDEAPDSIVATLLAASRGCPAECSGIVDRARAIQTAIADAGPDDGILLLGKGHEQTQTARGRTVPFSDHDLARASLGA